MRIESWPRNSEASTPASPTVSFNLLTSGWFEASTGFGPSSFFFTGGFGAPGAPGAAFCAPSFAANTRALAASTCASFSASAEGGEADVAARASSCGAAGAGASVGGPDSGGLPSCAIETQLHSELVRAGLRPRARDKRNATLTCEFKTGRTKLTFSTRFVALSINDAIHCRIRVTSLTTHVRARIITYLSETKY